MVANGPVRRAALAPLLATATLEHSGDTGSGCGGCGEKKHQAEIAVPNAGARGASCAADDGKAIAHLNTDAAIPVLCKLLHADGLLARYQGMSCVACGRTV
eukprot:6198442-Pleurochrysis_carterae.AAC.1